MEIRQTFTKWKENALDLFVDCGLALVGVFLPGDGLIGHGGHEGQLLLELLEGLEHHAGDGAAVGLAGRHGDHGPIPRSFPRNSQARPQPVRCAAGRGLGGGRAQKESGGSPQDHGSRETGRW